ncbi:MAG: DUF5312 domain-containing protein [Treponema sp.]|nr:DUF5312 domain-containing protein [Treponema sp.]
MEETGSFNRLVSELSIEERAQLLEKLTSQASMVSSILYEELKDEDEPMADVSYPMLPWYYKFWFFIISFFNAKPPVKLFEDHLMNRMFRNLDDASPGFYHPQKNMLLPKFHDELINLKEGSRFFYNALDLSFNQDKGGLMVFLGSLEMPEIHKQIAADTDPAVLTSRYPEMNEVELRQRAVKTLEDALAGITEEERKRMYRSAKSLFCLKQLSSFLFDRLINTFIYDSSSQGNICPAASAEDQLSSLNNILCSLKVPPPISLLESLFIFVLMEKSDQPNLDVHNEMRKLLVKAETSLQAIRDFNLAVPLTRLLRCITRNPGYAPKNIGGGEDWYVVYRDRWKFRVEENFLSFTRTKRQRDIQNSLRYFFKGANLKMLDNMGSTQNPMGINVRGNFSLSFLQTFYSVIFMGEINKYLRPILIDGEFIRRENRTEFTESYNNLIKLDDIISRFDHAISPEGDYGKRYVQAKNDMSSLPIKRRKVQIVVEEAAHDAGQIIGETREALEGMFKILEGILKKNADEKYDTLSNFFFFAGRSTVFQEGLNESIKQLKKTLQLLDDIDAMESGR